MQGIHLFSVRNIPVGFQPGFLLLVFILSFGMGDIGTCVVFGICVILGVLIHELGHALIADRYGLRPEIMLHMMGGITQHAKPASARQEFLVTLAGPMAGLICGGVVYGLLKVLEVQGIEWLVGVPYIYVFLYYFSAVNIFWGIFNLLPAIPMDGSKLLSYIVHKICKNPVKAAKISVVISLIFVGLILVWSITQKSMWMILLSVFFVMSNLQVAREVFRSSGSSERRSFESMGLEAEKIYERGLVAAREHNWKALEVCGHQMKKAAKDSDQTSRAYEFLTIACTNLEKYEEALAYSEHARQSDAVCQAISRCRSLTKG